MAAPEHLTGSLCNALQQDYSDETSEICSRLGKIGGLAALQHSSRHSDVCKCLESLLSPVRATLFALCEGLRAPSSTAAGALTLLCLQSAERQLFPVGSACTYLGLLSRLYQAAVEQPCSTIQTAFHPAHVPASWPER